MLRGYRGVIAAIAGLVTLVVALGTGAYFGSLYSPDHKQYQAVAGDQSKAGDYAGPSQSLPDISGLPGPVERAIANPKPATGQDHEIRDLAAQEASALWAFWMVIASFASVLITAVGTAFLYKQIVLTREAVEDTGLATEAMREANKIARDNSHLELRAYLSVQSVTLSEHDSSDNMLVILLEIKNAGQTPAVLRNIHLQAHWACQGGGLILLEHVSRNDIRCHRDTPMHIAFNVAADDPKLDLPGHFMVFGRIEYKDVFGKPQKEPFSFQSPVGFVTLDEHDLPQRLAAFSPTSILDAVKEETAKREAAKAKDTPAK